MGMGNVDPNDVVAALMSALGGNAQNIQSSGNDQQLQLLISTLQAAVIAVNGLNTTLANTFPQQGSTSTTATGGAATLPANPVGFFNTVINGVNAKVPYYAA